MRKILTLLLLLTSVMLVISCSPKQAQTTSTPVGMENRIALPAVSIETAYPFVQGNVPTTSYPSGIETAYPSFENTSTPLPAGTLPIAPKEAPEPGEGKASISGVLYLFTDRRLLTATEFFLMPSLGTTEPGSLPAIVAPDPNRGDIIGTSDDTGVISINDVPPGKYYLVVWAPMNWALAQVSADETTPLVMDLKDGSRNPLGVIYISLP